MPGFFVFFNFYMTLVVLSVRKGGMVGLFSPDQGDLPQSPRLEKEVGSWK